MGACATGQKNPSTRELYTDKKVDSIKTADSGNSKPSSNQLAPPTHNAIPNPSEISSQTDE